MGFHTTGPAVKNHISSEMTWELIAIYPTMVHLWFLVYQRVLPQLHLHLLRHHLHHRIPCLMSTETPKIQYQKEVEVRVKSFGETRCMNPHKQKTKIKMKDAQKYKKIYRMNCLAGYWNSERTWLMKVLQQTLLETQSKEDETLPSHLMNFQWSREQKWNRIRVSTVYIRTFRRTPIVISAWRRKSQGPLAEDVLVQSCPERNILVTWSQRITKFSVKKVNRETIIDMPWWYKTWKHSGYNHTRVNKNIPGDPEEPDKVPGADEETKSHLHWQFLGIWQVFWGIILESLYVNTTQIRNKWGRKSHTWSERRDICGAVAVWSG